MNRPAPQGLALLLVLFGLLVVVAAVVLAPVCDERAVTRIVGAGCLARAAGWWLYRRGTEAAR